MANTGIKIVLTLEQLLNGTPTGVTKPNVSGDPDYIAPFMDVDPTTGCPITYTTSCPGIVATPGSGLINFEFSLPNSSVNNPAVDTVKLQAIQGGVPIEETTFFLPNASPNFFLGSVVGLAAGSYTLRIEYLLGSTVIHDCPETATSYTVT